MEHINVTAKDLPALLDDLEDRGDVAIVAVVPAMLTFFGMSPQRYEVTGYTVFYVEE